MTTVATTRDWSDAITVTANVRGQAMKGCCAISIGTSAPSHNGLIINEGETIDIPAGDFRIRSIDAGGGSFHYQNWEL
jgi:type 1 fimbria pilin